MNTTKLVGTALGNVVELAVNAVVVSNVSRMSPHLGHKAANKIVAQIAAYGIGRMVSRRCSEEVKKQVEEIAGTASSFKKPKKTVVETKEEGLE